MTEPFFKVYSSNYQYKSAKNGKNKIRPANCKFDGVVKPSVRSAVRNHNLRKGPVFERAIAMDFYESMAIFYLVRFVISYE